MSEEANLQRKQAIDSRLHSKQEKQPGFEQEKQPGFETSSSALVSVLVQLNLTTSLSEHITGEREYLFI